MSTKIYRLTDTDGDLWHVCPGDPAHPLCDYLDRQGWDTIRLPAAVLIAGRVRKDDDLGAGLMLHGVVESLEGLDPDPATDAMLLDWFASARQLEVLRAAFPETGPEG